MLTDRILKRWHLLLPLFAWIAPGFASTARGPAELRLAPILGDSMVLQQQTAAPLWGWDTPGTAIEVRASWDEEAHGTTTQPDGRWMISLPTPAAGGPHSIAVQGTGRVTLTDVLIGEVWLCSGQSNMEWPLRASSDAERNIAQANHPRLRLFNVERQFAPQPRDTMQGTWAACTSESATEFSAVGYWFGRNLLENLPACADGRPMPVGLIGSNWGGTVVESWTSRKGLESAPEFDPFFDKLAEYDGAQVDLGLQQKRWWEALDKRLLGENNQPPRFESFSASEVAPVPGSFADWDQAEFDGCAWYVTRVELPASLQGRDLRLEIDAIDDMDMAFFDGEPIGATRRDGQWNQPRKYTVPASLTGSGEHDLAICVVDTGSAGRLGGQAGYVRLRAGDEVLNLAGEWRASAHLPLQEVGAFPRRAWFHHNRPTALYNGMIAPLIPFALQGAIWYQGESNRGRAQQYRHLFPSLIQDWRQAFGDQLTFLWVQLAPFKYGGDQGQLAELREAQTMTLSLPRTGMAVTMDIGNTSDIHPRNKHDVGRRLALLARRDTYGEKDLVAQGPVFRSMQVEADRVLIEFDHAEGLATHDGQAPTCFTLAGEDQVFYPATATIKGTTIALRSSGVAIPVAARFAWGTTDEPNLINGAKLPAGSFRSDDWMPVSSAR